MIAVQAQGPMLGSQSLREQMSVVVQVYNPSAKRWK